MPESWQSGLHTSRLGMSVYVHIERTCGSAAAVAWRCLRIWEG
jgi:hypothetical protein